MSVNKFLGIDSINVLKDYIDKTILHDSTQTRVITLQAYKYVNNTDGIPEAPQGGLFDTKGPKISYPEGWASLNSVINSVTGTDNKEEQSSLIEDALKNGSIYMSVGVLEGDVMFSNWSTPVKISGQNGVTIQFEYSHDINGINRTSYAKGVDPINRKEYIWTKYGDDDWVGPVLWAVYASDASDVIYKYCVTESSDAAPAKPSYDGDPNWMNSAAASVSQDKPFMWMVSKRVPAGANASECQWSDPILFGHYGKDGIDGKDGLDGNVPSYSITLYYKTDINYESIPEFICNVEDNDNDVIGDKIDDALVNNPDWKKVPESINDNSMLWYIVVNVNGGDRENTDKINTISNVSEVMRFSAIDGELKSYPTIRYEYYWSSTQDLPDGELEWITTPICNITDIEGSLWMRCGEFVINTVTNTEEQTKEWSDPIKITGPRGPIAYDYRVESQFAAGDDKRVRTAYKNTISEVDLTRYSYLWEKRYLMLYKMKYNEVGDVVEDTSVAPKVIKTFGEFRLSGLNGAVGANGKDGANGNRQNSIHYATTDNIVTIYNFDEINYFISNSVSDTHYTINGNKFGNFESGYTGKFTNIGTGNMIITTVDAKIVGSNTNVTEIIVKPQESIDLIGYNNHGECEFILIGKPIEDVNNPIENPGVLSTDELLTAIELGGTVKVGGDLNLTSPLVIENDVTIDLDGHTLTAPKFMESGGQVLEGDSDSYVFWVKNGNLTIRGNGKAIAQPADYSMAVWCQGGNVTIESGEFRNGGESCSLIYASGTGNITIKGGKFIATPKGPQAGTGDDYTALNLKNGDKDTCSITVNGGHFYRFDPANNLAEGENTNFVAEGFTSINNGDYFSVIPLPEI